MADDNVVARRDFLRVASGAAAAVGVGGLRPRPARAQGRSIKIGYVGPQTGPLLFEPSGQPLALVHRSHPSRASGHTGETPALGRM